MTADETDDPVARAVMTSMDNPEECHARVGEGWSCNQPRGHVGPHGVVYVAASAGADPRAEDDIAAYAKWRRNPNRVTADRCGGYPPESDR